MAVLVAVFGKETLWWSRLANSAKTHFDNLYNG
jgi:hypothetical protein